MRRTITTLILLAMVVSQLPTFVLAGTKRANSRNNSYVIPKKLQPVTVQSARYAKAVIGNKSVVSTFTATTDPKLVPIEFENHADLTQKQEVLGQQFQTSVAPIATQQEIDQLIALVKGRVQLTDRVPITPDQVTIDKTLIDMGQADYDFENGPGSYYPRGSLTRDFVLSCLMKYGQVGDFLDRYGAPEMLVQALPKWGGYAIMNFSDGYVSHQLFYLLEPQYVINGLVQLDHPNIVRDSWLNTVFTQSGFGSFYFQGTQGQGRSTRMATTCELCLRDIIIDRDKELAIKERGVDYAFAVVTAGCLKKAPNLFRISVCVASARIIQVLAIDALRTDRDRNIKYDYGFRCKFDLMTGKECRLVERP